MIDSPVASDKEDKSESKYYYIFIFIGLLVLKGDEDQIEAQKKVQQRIKDSKKEEEAFVLDKSNPKLLAALAKYQSKS